MVTCQVGANYGARMHSIAKHKTVAVCIAKHRTVAVCIAIHRTAAVLA